MSKNKYVELPEEPQKEEEDLDTQIARLRELLTLMRPESGASALGAMREAAPHVPLSERVRALSGYRG